MAIIDPVFSFIPPVTGDVDYSPLGGVVGLEASDVAKIQAVASAEATAALEAGYSEAGDGEVLDHCRKRNLGII
jgi:hypothetical protein